MADSALFIGVVSHERSRFTTSQGPDGLAAGLAAALPGTTVRVNTADLANEQKIAVTPAMVQATLTAELQLDRRWSRFLGRSLGPRWQATHAARWAKRAMLAVRPPSVQTVRRLLNIELSHLDLMRRGIESEAPWVLIVEDDGASTDIDDLAAGLTGLMSTTHPPAFVNLSQSFKTGELGIDHLLRPASGVTWAGSATRSVLAAQKPVTNTVCAILYSASFLRDLMEAMDALPMEPVVPIDWKLNLALMLMFEQDRIAPGSCWLVEPAPILQMSMQPAGILPQ